MENQTFRIYVNASRCPYIYFGVISRIQRYIGKIRSNKISSIEREHNKKKHLVTWKIDAMLN